MGSIPRTGLSLETKKWDLFRMRRLDGISSCIIVIITGKLNRGYLLENCCCYLVIKMSRNTSSTGVLIDLKLGVEKIVLREFKVLCKIRQGWCPIKDTCVLWVGKTL